MSGQPYKTPPITEAVIEVRFAETLDLTELDKGARQLSSVYSHQDDVRNLGFAVGMSPLGPPQATINEQQGRRLTSDDLTQIAILWPANFVVAQLAPYPGWEEFFGRFSRDWTLWKRAIGYRKVARVGVRYINRIDVPTVTDTTAANSPTMDQTAYLNVYPQLPASLRPVANYAVQAQVPLDDIGCGLIINSGAVPSPVLGYKSYLLDFDIYREPDPPQNDEGIYELLNRIRVKKNQVFDDCVSERAKETFRQ
jgi:uncharacterized protein (TIGR04255 family)